MSYPIAVTASNVKKIKIVDKFGMVVRSNVEISRNTIYIEPLDEYIPEATYKLVIERGLENTHGKSLPKGMHMTFYYYE